MYSLALVTAGAILIAYSIAVCIRLIPLIKWPYMRKQWRAVLYLICFFFIGYALYIYAIASGKAPFGGSLLVSAAMFSGAVFVFSVIRAGYHLVDWLAASETEVITNKRILVYDKGMLEKDRKELENKMFELESALEDVYAVRMEIEKGKMGKKRINQRLEKIRGKYKIDVNI